MPEGITDYSEVSQFITCMEGLLSSLTRVIFLKSVYPSESKVLAVRRSRWQPAFFECNWSNLNFDVGDWEHDWTATTWQTLHTLGYTTYLGCRDFIFSNPYVSNSTSSSLPSFSPILPIRPLGVCVDTLEKLPAEIEQLPPLFEEREV